MVELFVVYLSVMHTIPLIVYHHHFSISSKISFMQVIQAMVQMGVLVPTGDMTAVRRTALFFLNRCFSNLKPFF